MGLIEEFIARYCREFDYYDQTARLIAQALDSNLQAAGIRSMVTSRAKSPARLEAKVRQRARTKNFTTLEEISADIVDLAGARVALYFPGERDQVDRLVKQLFPPGNAQGISCQRESDLQEAVLRLLGHALPGATEGI